MKLYPALLCIKCHCFFIKVRVDFFELTKCPHCFSSTFNYTPIRSDDHYFLSESKWYNPFTWGKISLINEKQLICLKNSGHAINLQY